MSTNSSTTVLVTGGSGFIGSYVILALLAAGYTVRTTVRNLSREASIRTALKNGGATASDLERLSFTLLQNEMPVTKPVRLLGVSLSALQHVDDAEPQLALPM